ncbi:MAG: hypothetical protein INH13_25620 [Cupriavidus sp.]|nr:hypothetical protein [Cupriavidus sp.]
MGSEDDTRDRVIALDRDVAHLSAKVQELTVAVDKLTDALSRMRGGRLVLVTLLTAAGGVGAAIAQAFPWSHLFR